MVLNISFIFDKEIIFIIGTDFFFIKTNNLIIIAIKAHPICLMQSQFTNED